MGFPASSAVKNSPAGDAGNTSLIPGPSRSTRGRNGNPLQYSCLENYIDQRSLADYSPWGRKVSDTTERERKGHRVTVPVLISSVDPTDSKVSWAILASEHPSKSLTKALA